MNRIRRMDTQRIHKSIASVKTSMEVEGSKVNRLTLINGRRFLAGKISSDEAINNITKELARSRKK